MVGPPRGSGLGRLKMGFGSGEAGSGFLRPMGALSSLLKIVYLPRSSAIVSDEELRGLSKDEWGSGLLVSATERPI